MYRQYGKLLSILVFVLSILARSATGAPNAQVEVFNAESGINAPHSISVDTPSYSHLGDRASIQKDGTKSHIKSYKKYVSPDRTSSFHSYQIPVEASSNLHKFREIWIFSSLPQVIHSNAPPMTTGVSYSMSHFIDLGELGIERTHSSYSGWRVSLLSSRS